MTDSFAAGGPVLCPSSVGLDAVYTFQPGLHDLLLCSWQNFRCQNGGTRAILAGTRSDLSQGLPLCASDLLAVLTIVVAGALLEDCAGTIADGCAMLPYHSTWAIRAY